MRSGLERRFGACVGVAAAALAGCGDAPDTAVPPGLFDAGVARVEVTWRDPGGTRSRAFGTAFRVGSRGELLTARHVADNARTEVQNLGAAIPARIRVVLAPASTGPARDGGTRSFDVAIAAEDLDADLALLRIVETSSEGEGPGPGGSAAEIAWAEPPPEAEIALVGYPVGEPDLVVRSGRLLDPALVGETLERPEPFPPWLADLLLDGAALLADVEARLGNSGSPVLLAETGEIIGLCSSVITRADLEAGSTMWLPARVGDPITVVISARRIRRFLDAQGVSWR